MKFSEGGELEPRMHGWREWTKILKEAAGE